MRILDNQHVVYQERVLNIKEALDGVTCAHMLGLDLHRTFKTLVTISKNHFHYVFVVPVAEKLDLKKAAKVVGEKDLAMLPQKELLALTGYVHGGCSPIGMKKVFKTIIDETALCYDNIVFSGGKIGYFIEVNPKDIACVIPVIYADIIESREVK